VLFDHYWYVKNEEPLKHPSLDNAKLLTRPKAENTDFEEMKINFSAFYLRYI